MSSPAPTTSRRTLLGGALATVLTLGAGCGCGRPSRSQPATVADLRKADPFYIAHRGGGRNWPEMTSYAYQRAAEIPGLDAMEVSVCVSADGVLVCSHDPTTKRVSGIDYTIAAESWATLSTVMVKADETTDPGQPARPLTRFDTVAEEFLDRYVLFTEPKVEPAAQPLFDALKRSRQAERVVWKQYVNSAWFDAAKQAGFGTWGYVLNQPSHTGANLDALAAKPSIDMLGAPLEESDEFVRTVAQAAARNDKPAIAWPVRSDEDRRRALALGCSGLMTSAIADVRPSC